MLANLENSTMATGLEKISFHSNPKEDQCHRTYKFFASVLISHPSKVMLKILPARLLKFSSLNWLLPNVQVGFQRGRGTRDQIANMCWIMERARKFQINIYFFFIDYTNVFDCVDHNKLWQILKEIGSTWPPYLSPEKPVCRLRNNH